MIGLYLFDTLLSILVLKKEEIRENKFKDTIICGS